MQREKGAVTVEAVIIFPMVMMTVFVLLYLGLFKLQEMAVIYQVQRAAHQGAMVLSSPGYQELGEYDTPKIDFTASPAPEQVKEYYRAYHEKDGHKNIGVLYRELRGINWSGAEEMRAFLEELGRQSAILAGMPLTSQEAAVHRGIFGTTLHVDVVIKIRTPGALRYLGIDDSLQFRRGASSFAINPAGFVRGVDLAGDAAVVVSEKLGFDGKLETLMEKYQEFVKFAF